MKALRAKLTMTAAVLGLAAFALGSLYSVETVQANKFGIKSFCEYGTGVALQLGAGGAIWEVSLGGKPNEWYDCEAQPSVGFLNKHTVGLLQTTTAGLPEIDANMIVYLPFAGETSEGGGLLLTEYAGGNNGKVVGEILLEVEDGMFVANLNAADAVVDEIAEPIIINFNDNDVEITETITADFGSSVVPGPSAYATIVETSGKYKSIQQVEPWEWSVSGTITLARVPGLDLQTNILAALAKDSPLLLAAQEEIVLSGSYYRR